MREIERRNLVKGAAWAVPAVAVAAAAPLAAASTPAPPTGIVAYGSDAISMTLQTNGNRTVFYLLVPPRINLSSVPLDVFQPTASAEASYTLFDGEGVGYPSLQPVSTTLMLGGVAALPDCLVPGVIVQPGTYSVSSNPTRFSSLRCDVTMTFTPKDGSAAVVETYPLNWTLEGYCTGFVLGSGIGSLRYSGMLTAAV